MSTKTSATENYSKPTASRLAPAQPAELDIVSTHIVHIVHLIRPNYTKPGNTAGIATLKIYSFP